MKKLQRLLIGLAVLLACGYLSLACDGANGSGDGDNASDLAKNCQSRCEAKATSCEAPPDIADSECAKHCGMNVTEPQLQCVEESSCESLMKDWEQDSTVCGIGKETGVADTDKPGNTGKKLGETCDCPDEGDWVSCSGTNAECLPELSCVEFGDQKICTHDCEANPSSCGSALECTVLVLNGAEMGEWCWRD